ncbi:MAG: putative Multidrug resistance-associated protein, partial [Streblomastix strix]
MKSIAKEGYGKSSEQKLKIIEQGVLKEICKVIHSQLEGEMNWNKQFIILLGYEAASTLIINNKESFPFAIESGGIVDEFISLLNKLPIDDIFDFHTNPLNQLINSSNFEQRKILVEKGILKRILYGIGFQEGEGKPNPVREELEKDGTLTKLIEIFQNDKYGNKGINSCAAFSIGRLYKASPLPSEIGNAIIIYLKEVSTGTDLDFSCQSILTLTCLAECKQLDPKLLPHSLKIDSDSKQISQRNKELNRGRILIDGIDISKVDLSRMRSSIAIIPQDPTLFTGTLRFNFDIAWKCSDDRIWKVLDMIDMRELVSSLPLGLDTQVAEGGSNFSSGQRQLICFGRAILNNCRIVVMDEATASVDVETDAKIQKTVRDQFKERTVLIIAHRLNTIMNCDRIMVMNDGQLVEFDTPAKLLANSNSTFQQTTFSILNASSNYIGVFEGISFIHNAGLVHRDIKCDNLLLHSPPGSGRDYAKISDLG